MQTKLLKIVRKAYGSPTVPRHINRANQKKWIRSMRVLGDKWLLATPVSRRSV